MSSPAPAFATIAVTPVNSCALFELAAELIRPDEHVAVVRARIRRLDVNRLGVSLRSPWMRFFELGPTESVSVPLFSLPRNGRPREVDVEREERDRRELEGQRERRDEEVDRRRTRLQEEARISPEMSNTASGSPPLARMFDAISSSRTLPSLFEVVPGERDRRP